ncbi:AAA family ATPase [Nonomuraea sp. FMUSA5-5]|uniref:AAA family ATPase n=1 Tax=Nonomuraea composti TaxID=2720023 RepID=A0ABX1AZI1_9ACTN|nr:AAA family ATPase [Nonomuraea sp. FMUSA5-5]
MKLITMQAGEENGESAMVIIGRDRERAELSGMVRSTAGRVLVVRGGAGVGKSALLEEAAELAVRDGHLVIRITGGGGRVGAGAFRAAPVAPAEGRRRPLARRLQRRRAGLRRAPDQGRPDEAAGRRPGRGRLPLRHGGAARDDGRPAHRRGRGAPARRAPPRPGRAGPPMGAGPGSRQPLRAAGAAVPGRRRGAAAQAAPAVRRPHRRAQRPGTGLIWNASWIASRRPAPWSPAWSC